MKETFMKKMRMGDILSAIPFVLIGAAAGCLITAALSVEAKYLSRSIREEEIW